MNQNSQTENASQAEKEDATKEKEKNKTMAFVKRSFLFLIQKMLPSTHTLYIYGRI